MGALALQEIVARLGGDLYSGGQAACIPGPGHSKRDRSLSLCLKDGRLLFHSFGGNSAEEVRAYLGLAKAPRAFRPPDWVRQLERRHRERQEGETRARRRAFCSTVWGATQSALGSPVETYLRRRGLTGRIPEALRFHPAAPLDYDRRRTISAMIALVSGPDGCPSGLHVTAILPDGTDKAFGRKSRFMFGDTAGGAARLLPAPPGGVLAVTEGIETALAFFHLTGTPTWAALSAPGVSTFVPPNEIGCLIVAADGDQAGVTNARALAARARRSCPCVVIPAPDGTDYNDFLKGQAS